MILFCIWNTRLKHVPKVKVSIREEIFDTAIKSLCTFCNTFTSTTLSKMIRFWICKDQNDSLHTAQHAEPLGGHIWSHFDWEFQSRRDQSPEIASGVQSKHLFCYNSPKSNNGKPPNFLYVEKGPLGQYKFLKKKILKLGADNFFGRFLIFSFGPWRPLGARKKYFFFAQIHYWSTPNRSVFYRCVIESTSQAPGWQLPTGWNINDLAFFLKSAATGLS